MARGWWCIPRRELEIDGRGSQEVGGEGDADGEQGRTRGGLACLLKELLRVAHGWPDIELCWWIHWKIKIRVISNVTVGVKQRGASS